MLPLPLHLGQTRLPITLPYTRLSSRVLSYLEAQPCPVITVLCSIYNDFISYSTDRVEELQS